MDLFSGLYVFCGAAALWLCGGLRGCVETEVAWRRLRTLTLLLGLYCLAAGLYWGIGWEDPFQGADPEEMSQVATHPKKGLALFVIRYWPWLLMLFGAYQGVKALSGEKMKGA